MCQLFITEWYDQEETDQVRQVQGSMLLWIRLPENALESRSQDRLLHQFQEVAAEMSLHKSHGKEKGEPNLVFFVGAW